MDIARRGSTLAERLGGSPALPALVVVVLTLLGSALRLTIAQQSLFADELSTYWIVSTNGLGGVVSTVHTDAEITPPLYFVMGWLTTRIDLTPELLRAPSLVAGAAAIPLTYVLGLRTVGRWAGLVAAALTTLSPFMVFYSTEARGYECAVVFVLLSTLAMLAGVGDGRARWWVAYAACSSAAVYTHYTTVFVLAAQLLWLMWAHPQARRAALLANAGAVVTFLPWLSGLIRDFNSPTTDILNALDVLDLHTVRIVFEHWSVGYPLPRAGLQELPGGPALVLLALAVGLAIAGVAITRSRGDYPGWLTQVDRRLVLVLALALGAPLGTALFSAVGTNLIAVRHLAASWPAFALLLAALLVAGPGRLRLAAAGLAVAAFGFGAVKMLEPRYQRPDYDAAAGFIERSAPPGSVVIDGSTLSPAPLTAIDVALDRPLYVFHIGRYRVQYDPFKLLAGPPSTAKVTGRAVAAAGGQRMFVVSSEDFAGNPPGQDELTRQVIAALPSGYRRVEARTYQGLLKLGVFVYAARASPRG